MNKICLRCGREILNGSAGRGLCDRCRGRVTRMGQLHRWPRSTRSRAELMAEWEVLRLRGMSQEQASVALGYAPGSLRRALERAARDARAA